MTGEKNDQNAKPVVEQASRRNFVSKVIAAGAVAAVLPATAQAQCDLGTIHVQQVDDDLWMKIDLTDAQKEALYAETDVSIDHIKLVLRDPQDLNDPLSAASIGSGGKSDPWPPT